MQRITTREAAKILNMDVLTLQYLLRDEKIPIGYAQRKPGKKRYCFIIYKEMLQNFISKAEDKNI